MLSRGFLLGCITTRLVAQTAAPPTAVAASYEQRYAEVMRLAPRVDRVAQVHDLTLRRDVGQLTLVSGTLCLLTPIGGRTVGAVFLGRGWFSFSPPDPIEQARLARFEKTNALESQVTAVVLLFADSTAAELERSVHFAPGAVPDGEQSFVDEALNHLGDDDSKTLDPDLMAALLNGESSDLFYAYIHREDGSPLTYEVDPWEREGVTLARRSPRTAWTRRPELITSFARAGARPAADASSERLGATPEIRAYRIDVTLTQTASADLNFTAAARLELTSATALGPWFPFELFYKLKVDSARWEGGGPASIFRGKDAELVWVKLDRPLAPGEVRSLLLYYHGDLIDRYGDFFYIKSSVAWYPLSLGFRNHATFDLTFHNPEQYLLASVGDRVDSTVSNRVQTTHWVTASPTRNASFNLGQFEPYDASELGVPPVTVMVSEEAHRTLAKELRQKGLILPEQRDMKETVGADVVQSLKFFQRVYGPAGIKHFYATEIPGYHGEAFPGLVNLSWITFQQTGQQGEDQVFRAHEVAHQWWGVGMDYATYHDQWLSEGFANFSGLWYLQTVTKGKNTYFDILHKWRADISLHKDEPSPIWLGYRATSSKDETGYDILIYEKGAWVLHMLRVLMLDLKSMNEDRFTAMMREFYDTYRGRAASTADFQRIVEQYAGIDMGWYFKEWVYGTAIPTYRVAYTTVASGGQHHVHLRVEQQNVPDDFQMYVPVTVSLDGGREARFRVQVKGPTSEMELPALPAAPKGLTFNALDGVLCDVKMVAW